MSLHRYSTTTAALASATIRGIDADSPLALVEEYTAYAGRLAPLPDWITSGPVIGYEGGTDAVVALHQRVLEAGIRPAAYWLQVCCSVLSKCSYACVFVCACACVVCVCDCDCE